MCCSTNACFPQPWVGLPQSAALPRTNMLSLPGPRVCPHWAPEQHKAAPRVEALGAYPAWAGALSTGEQPSRAQSVREPEGAHRTIEVARQPALAATGKQDPPSALPHSPPVGLWNRLAPGKNEGSNIWTVPQLPRHKSKEQAGLDLDKRQEAASMLPLVIFHRNVVLSQSHPAWTGTEMPIAKLWRLSWPKALRP